MMHELSVTEQILDIALRHAREAQAMRIRDVYLVIGELSSIVDDSVQFYWDFVSRGTIAEQSQLHFRRITAVMECDDCGHTYSPHQHLLCPACGSRNITITAGEEFYLEAIDVDKEEEEVSVLS